MEQKNFAEKKPIWFKLDNAAKIFPGQNSQTWSNSFRVCYQLKQRVQPELLMQALNDIMPRFPCYDVRIRKGFFWFYLEKNPKSPVIQQDINNPLYRVKFNENNNYLFRVYYYNCRIAVDCYHVLTDGHGGALFLSTLVARYLQLQGIFVPPTGFVQDITQSATQTQLEDAFVKNATSACKYHRAESFVYHAGRLRLPNHTVNIISGTLPFDLLHQKTKELDVTVTEFLSALMLRVLIDKQKREEKKQKEVSIQIPVDLRKAFQSDTLRNFTICLRVVINPNLGDYSFEELLFQVKYQLRLVNNKKELNRMITANMGLERNPLIRCVPLFVKNLGVGISFYFTAEQTTSSLITNLGNIQVPRELAQQVEKFIFMPAPGKVNSARLGVATLNNNLVITFANAFYECDVERDFFTSLVKMGIPVKIESNRE